MKPLLLHGHERSITMIKYNRQGDLLFSAAKDSKPTVWYSLNGERLGTFNGHGGVTWCLDVSFDTRHLMTGSGDNSLRIWDVETGQQVSVYQTQSGVRTCGYSFGSKQIMFTTDQSMGKECEMLFYDVRENPSDARPYLTLPIPQSKVTAAVWGPCDEYIVTGHENGLLQKWDAETGQVLDQIKDHSKAVNCIQRSHDDCMFISGSKDTTAKLFDMESFMNIKTYKTERPINSAAISPLRDHVILGGGQEAMEVTTTSTKVGKFDARFFHLIFEEEIGRVKGHFGPIQSIAIHPDGRSYSSGAEDGYVRIHQFDPSYFDFEFEY